MPDDYSGYSDDNRIVSKIAIDDVDSKAPLTWRYKIIDIQEIIKIDTLNEQLPLGIGTAEKIWKVNLIGYKNFHILATWAEIEVAKDSEGYYAITDSLREYFPGANLLIALMALMA